MRAFALVFCASVALGASVALASCASFTGEPGLTEPEASTDSPAGDGASDLDADASSDRASPGDGGVGATLRLPCPPPSGGTTGLESWAMRRLFEPADSAHRMYPFAIATDSTHVTWIAHPGTADGGDDTAPYNGLAAAVVMRAPKSGAAPAVVVARDQIGARALTLDETFVYWVTNENGGTAIRRQSRDVDCAITCPKPDTMLILPSGARVERMIRVAPKLLYLLGGNGVLYAYTVGATSTTLVATSGDIPGMTATTTDVFVSSLVSSLVKRAPVGGSGSQTEVSIPPSMDASVGVETLATDCTTLWMGRKKAAGGSELAAHLLGVDASFVSNTPSFMPLAEIHDLAVDARYVYAAAYNNGGIFVLDQTQRTTSRPYVGNVLAVAVDDDGVYFGEHDRAPQGGGPPGTLYMLVKK
jgi:hypothetical protein